MPVNIKGPDAYAIRLVVTVRIRTAHSPPEQFNCQFKSNDEVQFSNSYLPLSLQDMYKKKLTYFFQNKRDILKKEDLTAMNFIWRQKKSKSTTGQFQRSSSSTAAPPVWGVRNYLPSMPESEDIGSIERHTMLMQEEKKKKWPDIQRVETSMTVTLSARRKMIVQENATIQNIKDTYPWLFTESQVGWC